MVPVPVGRGTERVLTEVGMVWNPEKLLCCMLCMGTGRWKESVCPLCNGDGENHLENVEDKLGLARVNALNAKMIEVMDHGY